MIKVLYIWGIRASKELKLLYIWSIRTSKELNGGEKGKIGGGVYR